MNAGQYPLKFIDPEFIDKGKYHAPIEDKPLESMLSRCVKNFYKKDTKKLRDLDLHPSQLFRSNILANILFESSNISLTYSKGRDIINKLSLR
jgi:hypothetical protein